MPLIRTENLTKIYNRRRPDEMQAVRGVTLQVESGEVLALTGPSGSGKTSLLTLLGCMSRPTSGRIVVAERDVAKLPERFLTEVRRSTFGFIFQQFHLVRDLGALENVLLPLYPLPVSPAAMRRKGESLLARFGLAGKEKVKAGRLSGGEQQRVAIARALINDPRVLIADEPTAHLDSRLAADLLSILEELHREGRTIVVATHDPFVHTHALISRKIALRDGQVQEEG